MTYAVEGRHARGSKVCMSRGSSPVQAAIAAHEAAVAARRGAHDEISDAEFEVLMARESDTLQALALAPCRTEEAFAEKLGHLVAWSHADERDPERLIAIRTAVEAWLEETGARG